MNFLWLRHQSGEANRGRVLRRIVGHGHFAFGPVGKEKILACASHSNFDACGDDGAVKADQRADLIVFDRFGDGGMTPARKLKIAA